MRLLFGAILLCVVAGVTSSPAPASDKYTTRWDHIDVDNILKSERLLRNYFKCIMDQGPCTREGIELRQTIPDALQTECLKCSEIQKKQAGKIMAFIQLNHPEMWDAVLAKYDPEGTFRKKYGYGEDDDDYDEEEDEKN